MNNQPSQKKEYLLTDADRDAWWDYLQRELPENYSLAKRRKTGQDPYLGDLCSPLQIDVNDYFEIYGLPRVTATNREIRVNGRVVEHYRDGATYKRLREEFDKLHETEEYHKWKQYQHEVCQSKMCAWCRKPIYNCYDGSAEVDHIIPLLYFGDNRASNLVIACRDCNQEKKADIEGWNGGKGIPGPNSKPQWIKPNIYDRLW